MSGFLQTTGIASQASDAFDDQRQERRIRSQHEQMNQSQLDENQLYREIVRMAYEHEAQKEAAKEAAAAKAKAPAGGAPRAGLPTAPIAPVAPTVPGTGAVPFAPPFAPMDTTTNEGAFPPGYANGGAVTAERYNGIYDDAKVSKRLPTILHEVMQDWKQPGYAHGLNLEPTVRELISHVNSYADGGTVLPGDPSTSDPNADPNADKNRFLDTLLTTGEAAPPDVNAVVPGIRMTPEPTNIPGRLVNSQEPAINLVTQSGKPLSNNKGDAANAAPIGGGDASPGPGNTEGPSNAPSAAGIAANVGISTALGVANPVVGLISHLVMTTLANNLGVSTDPDTSLGISVATDPDAGVAGGPDDPGEAGVDASTGANAGETDASGPAGPDSSDGTGAGAGDGTGDGGGDGFKGGGILWNHFKSKMAPALTKKARPAAVKFKKNGGALKAGKGGPGGTVKGPGTGTSDSVPASLKTPGGSTQGINLSNGEYVLSADTVRAIGKDKLDALQARYHKQVR